MHPLSSLSALLCFKIRSSAFISDSGFKLISLFYELDLFRLYFFRLSCISFSGFSSFHR